MGCCLRVDTDVIMAVLFNIKPDICCSFYNLEELYGYLFKNCYTYFVSDFCEKEVRDTILKYPNLYRTIKKDYKSFICRSEEIPNLKFFLENYSEKHQNYVYTLIENWVKNYFDS